MLDEELNKFIHTLEQSIGQKLMSLMTDLEEINAKLWNVEDNIREHERKQFFGASFVELARSVYEHNDERSRLKRQINDLVGSKIVEEKSYTPYK